MALLWEQAQHTFSQPNHPGGLRIFELQALGVIISCLLCYWIYYAKLTKL